MLSRNILFAAPLILVAASFAADEATDQWQYPIHLGDTRAHAHSLLGNALYADATMEEYPASGVTLWFDQNRVTKLKFIGSAAEFYWTLPGQMLSDQSLLFGLTAKSGETSFREILGKPRIEESELQPTMNGDHRVERRLLWKKAGYVIDGLFFVSEGDNRRYPAGTLTWVEVYRGL